MTDSIPVPIEDWSDMINLSTENGGAEGWGRFIDLLASIRMTLDMVGLSFGSSWTHNSAIWSISKPHLWDNYQLWSRLSTPVLCLHSIVAIPVGKLLFLKLYNNKRKLNWSTRSTHEEEIRTYDGRLCTLRLKKGTILFSTNNF